MSEEYRHPFEWLPRAGEKREIPGGVIVCQSWEMRHGPGGAVDGEIVFRFFTSPRSFPPAELPAGQADPLALENGEGGANV